MAGKKSGAEVAAVLSKISKSHLECVICHERYHEPKILECLHNFCERCLATYQKSTKDPSIIRCPVCRKTMTFAPGTDIVASLKTNFHLVSMVEDFTLQEKLTQPKAKVICELCTDQQKAKSRCMDCPFFLCTSCQAIHQRISATAGHCIVPLDTLRSGKVSLRSKAQDEPPCEKHRGEKKRFYCLTCNQLICRDCTVVDHRESTHEFITLDEAADRFRKNTKELIQKFEENLAAYLEASTELAKMTTDLESSVLSTRQLVTNQAAEEESKIAKREDNFSKDIAKRQKLRTKVMNKTGIKITKSLATTAERNAATNEENKQKYSKTIDEKFASLDSSLAAFGKAAESIRKSDDEIKDLKVILKSEAAKDNEEDMSKVATNLDHFLKSIQGTFELRTSMIKGVGKMVSAEIEHMRQTVETASDAVKSSSNVDFLNLRLVVDSHLRVLLIQSPPRLPLGYSKMLFKSSDDTALGELILGATWKFAREINTGCNLISMAAASSNDEILVSSSNNYPAVFLHTFFIQRYLSQNYNGGIVATLEDSGNSSCTAVCIYNMVVHLYSNSCALLKQIAVPASIVQDGSNISLGQPVKVVHYRNQEIVISYSNWQGIVILDTSNGSMVRKIPVDIKPDFLACTSRGRILVASKKPARVECLDDNDASSLTIHPTVARSTTDGEKEAPVICSGLCRDSRDIIYVAVSIEGAQEIHIHQYTSCGSFVGCLTSGNISQPVIDIVVTGNGTLVVAEQNTLKFFETLKEEVTV
ncbi:uncharacterized protein LOC117304008 [Asterias rubens]|uniref:uncharacterized protein LOC117304008 n=1 Tax=Asterias rubens TaxID=7604 RepID=UPI0014557221|nr:uncharacterized protein LOC117304008 [Asterias rubens]